MKNQLRNLLLFFIASVLFMGCSNHNASISGTMKFSYLDIPKMEMNVYAKNVHSGDVYNVETTSKKNKFKITGVPAGSYIIYAYSKEAEIGEYVLPEKMKLYGGYSKAAMCSPEDACEDHKLIKIRIKDNQHVTNIVIGDWFTAEVPDE